MNTLAKNYADAPAIPVLPAHVFDARGVAKRFRHAAIFGALESLNEGETMRFVNDHDPLPLLQQMLNRYGHQIAINYVAREVGNIVIDFTVQSADESSQASMAAAASAIANATNSSAAAGGGCGGGGCGCAGKG